MSKYKYCVHSWWNSLQQVTAGITSPLSVLRILLTLVTLVTSKPANCGAKKVLKFKRTVLLSDATKCETEVKKAKLLCAADRLAAKFTDQRFWTLQGKGSCCRFHHSHYHLARFILDCILHCSLLDVMFDNLICNKYDLLNTLNQNQQWMWLWTRREKSEEDGAETNTDPNRGKLRVSHLKLLKALYNMFLIHTFVHRWWKELPFKILPVIRVQCLT